MSLRTLIMRALTAGFLALAAVAPGRAEAPPAPLKQTAAEAEAKSAGCISCHTATDSASMHSSPGVVLGCTDCHGGNAGVLNAAGAPPGSPDYRRAQDAAHVQPRYPEAWNWPSSAKPPRTY